LQCFTLFFFLILFEKTSSGKGDFNKTLRMTSSRCCAAADTTTAAFGVHSPTSRMFKGVARI
jgi:hypothetical protein